MLVVSRLKDLVLCELFKMKKEHLIREKQKSWEKAEMFIKPEFWHLNLVLNNILF